jgi:signal transduction histidine kinase
MPATDASFQRAQVRQRAMSRLLKLLILLVTALVEAGVVTGNPGAGTHGARAAVLVAGLAFAVGIAGIVIGDPERPTGQALALVLIVASSAALVRLQPNGPGNLGAFVAVAVAAMRLPGRLGAGVAVVAILALPAAEVAGSQKSTQAIALDAVGVLAFYTIAVLANRLREGQEQAERLLHELAENREAQARSAVLAERQRLAREMHDVLAHSLSALALQLEGGRLLAERAGASYELVGAFQQAHRLARTGLEEARRAIGLLRDDELPGPEQLPQLLRELERDTAVATAMRITGDARALSADARLTLYRAAQEALTNVRKHAACTNVELRLDYEDRGARLTVEDFAEERPRPAQASAGGYGLTGMRERAELLGGSLVARPTEHGFRIEVWVPS